jgi:hypothetical protein
MTYLDFETFVTRFKIDELGAADPNDGPLIHILKKEINEMRLQCRDLWLRGGHDPKELERFNFEV